MRGVKWAFLGMVLAQVSAGSVGVINLGLDTSLATGGLLLDNDRIVFSVSELYQDNTDLNGDGDAFDGVLHVYDAATGTTSNVGLHAAGSFVLDGDRIAFRVSEGGQGKTDLNGDNDTTDNVLHVHDAATGTTVNLGLAGGGPSLLDGDRIAFRVFEGGQGNTNLNGDTDTSDNVLHVLDLATNSILNLGLDAENNFLLDGDIIAFNVSEFGQGKTDLNSDGDTKDYVLHVHNAATRNTVNLGLNATGGFRLDGDRIAFRVSEGGQGSTDLNGDGDALDDVLHVHDAATGTTDNLGLDARGRLIDGDRIAFRVSESRQGNTDLNGDGDALDDVLHLHDAATDTTFNLGLAVGGFPFVLDGDRIAFGVSEGGQGNTDLNNDGDAADFILHVYDAAAGTTVNLGLDATGGLVIDGDQIAFSVSETVQGNADLNGDSDTSDFVLHVHDAAAGTTFNLGLAAGGMGFPIVVDGVCIAFSVSESLQGNTDLNADGDISDYVLHVHDAATGITTNLGLDAAGIPFVLDAGRIAFSVSEFRQGNTDLNGDSDTLDKVLHTARMTFTPEQLIELLIQDVQELGLPGMAGQAQLNASLNALAQDPPDIQGAIDALQAFINFVNAQRGNKIPLQEADDLIVAAQAIIDLLSG